MVSSIVRVEEAGQLIKLADGSRWRVASFDAFHTRMWSVGDSVQYDFTALTNTSRGKRVNASRA